MLPKLLLAALALAPTLASAAIFPAGSKVRQVDAKGFRQAMKSDVRSSLFHTSFLFN